MTLRDIGYLTQYEHWQTLFLGSAGGFLLAERPETMSQTFYSFLSHFTEKYLMRNRASCTAIPGSRLKEDRLPMNTSTSDYLFKNLGRYLVVVSIYSTTQITEFD